MESYARQVVEADVCVVGGGVAGMCAAISAARNGARTVLMHDRPVFGGNASSEVRMWICGAPGQDNKETGIVEEIQLEHCYRNPAGNYSIWDSILYEKIAFQPNLTMLLNCSCTGCRTEQGRIVSVEGWQLTSQICFTVKAKLFIDCSGDSVLAPPSGAEYRTGREARNEHGEDIQPSVADRKTMGNSLLIQLRKTDSPQPFIPPKWAYKFERPEDLPRRMNGVNGTNFWWIELGGLLDTIGDAEAIRDDLYKVAYGVWDYIKNRAPERAEAANWALEWLGSLPGKRENRRYVGAHVLTQNDIRAGGQFDDVVAYGGWPMDDHHPAGILYPGAPTIFHGAPSPYGIPLRSLYSRNVANLLFAGRNISVTHAALSSTRVMGTCALLGQAAGTAAALCTELGCLPGALLPTQVPRLQEQLMHDDVWLPGFRRSPTELTMYATITGEGSQPEAVRDGLDRNRPNEDHAWEAPLGAALTLSWDQPLDIAGLRLVFDSDLRDVKRMPCSFPLKGDRCAVPRSLVKAFRVEAQDRTGAWSTVYREDANHQRLVYVPLAVCTNALRLVPESTWGAANARVFAVDALADFTGNLPAIADGPRFAEVVAKVAPADLAPPEGGQEEEGRKASA